MNKLLLVLLIGLVVFAYADAPIYGYFWLRYTYDNPTTPEVEKNANYFSIERGYIRWKTSTSPVSFSGTIDIAQKSGATNASDWNIRLKYAQADWVLPGISQSLPDFRMIFGLQKVFFGYIDKWEYPLIEKALEDAESKMNSADLGVSIWSYLPAGYGDFAVQVFNGRGYSTPVEDNTNKAICGNLSLIPYPGILIRGSYYMSDKNVGDSIITQVAADRYAGALQAHFGPVTVVGEYLGTTDDETKGMGYIGFVEFMVTKNVSICGRYDYFDPDTDVDNNGHNRIMAGINWMVSPCLTISPNYEIKGYEAEGQESVDKAMVQFKYSY